ncbi:MAG: hypothetical protein QME71_06335 [Dehalococcoidia bacterium]|nr:hypothetical protein [Dehalococcoidia bacterium]
MAARAACLLTATLVALVLGTGPRLIIAQTPEAATPTPAPEATASGLRLEHECSPNVMRPNEWTVVECVTRYINESDEARPAGRVEIVPATAGPAVETFFIEVRRNGELLPVAASPTSFEGEGIPPHQTVESRAVLLMNMRAEGESRSELRVVSHEGVVAASTPLVFVGDPSAADPPKELSTFRRFWGVGRQAIYVVTLKNTSASEATGLLLTVRHDGPVALTEADPAASSVVPAAGLASWDLSSFGALAPGESIDVFRASYGLKADADCGSVTAAAVVKATVGGVERAYAVAPMNSGWFGECGPPDGTGAGGDEQPGETGEGSVTLPATGQAGEGGAGGSNAEATLLAALGISLLATGMVVRKLLAAKRRIGRGTYLARLAGRQACAPAAHEQRHR